MKEYLRILKNVLENGQPKQPTRYDSNGVAVPVENGTIGTFCEVFRHDMSKGFPLLTARKMPWKSIRVELEGFIKGVTDKYWFQERGCKFWNEWSNPVIVQAAFAECEKKAINGVKNSQIVKKGLQEILPDLGPIYGYQWRNFDQHYEDLDAGRIWSEQQKKYTTPNDFWDYHGANAKSTELDGHIHGYDQFKYIVDTLKKNPYDRRMVCSAWNPNQLHLMALPACHILWNVVVYGNKLNLTWFQRSCDLYLGVPANIASYALLLKLLAKEANLEEGELVGVLSDCHLYSNQIEQSKELLTREPFDLPNVTIPDDWGGIYDWTWDKVNLEGYQCHEALSMAVTV